MMKPIGDQLITRNHRLHRHADAHHQACTQVKLPKRVRMIGGHCPCGVHKASKKYGLPIAYPRNNRGHHGPRQPIDSSDQCKANPHLSA